MDDRMEIRRAVFEGARKMWRHGMAEGSAGNVSARVPGEPLVAITPSNVLYEMMVPEDVVVVDMEGEVVLGERNPSFETTLHLAVYAARDDVGALFHTHAVYSFVLAVAGKPLPPVMDEFIQYVGGSVEVAGFGESGSEELSENALAALGEKNAVILANHGNLCCGRDLDKAWHVAQLVEKGAKVTILAGLIGGARPLPEEIVEAETDLFDMMKEL